ncbi:hypothetical protein Tco_1472981, partial [Tanacetum coccineum]
VQRIENEAKTVLEQLEAWAWFMARYWLGRGSVVGSVGDYVLLKVSPWEGVVRFGKKGKLAPGFVGPLDIIEKVGLVAYRLDLPEELNGVHDTFHVSNLKSVWLIQHYKCLSMRFEVDGLHSTWSLCNVVFSIFYLVL